MKNRYFRDCESGTIVTMKDLFCDYVFGVVSESIDPMEQTFGQYVNNCQTYNNGTLTELR